MPFPSFLKISIWNRNGFTSSKAQLIKKTGCLFFKNILRNNDLICFSETWRDSKDESSFDFNDHFEEFHQPGFNNHIGGRPSGGCLFLFENQF